MIEQQCGNVQFVGESVDQGIMFICGSWFGSNDFI